MTINPQRCQCTPTHRQPARSCIRPLLTGTRRLTTVVPPTVILSTPRRRHHRRSSSHQSRGFLSYLSGQQNMPLPYVSLFTYRRKVRFYFALVFQDRLHDEEARKQSEFSLGARSGEGRSGNYRILYVYYGSHRVLVRWFTSQVNIVSTGCHRMNGHQ